MRLTTVTNEANVGVLADRLYANLTPASRKAAESALLEANPHLAGPVGFTPGMIVRVPAVPGLKVKEGSVDRDPVADVLKRLTDIVSDYQQRLAKSMSATNKDLAEQAAVLKSSGRAIGKVPDAKPLAARLTASLAERAKTLSDIEQRLPAVFAAIVKDLESLP